MAVRIGSNPISLSIQRQLSAATQDVSSSSERLSSGLRINRAVDDAAGLAIAETLNHGGRVFGQGIKNINDTLSLAAVQKSALDELGKITVRQKELSEQSANGVYSDRQRDALDREARELTNEYNRIINTTEFNGRKILLNPNESMRTQFGMGTGSSIEFLFAEELGRGGGSEVVAGQSASELRGGDYFTLSAVDQDYYVWFTVDGEGSDPALINQPLQSMEGRRVDLVTDPEAAREEVTSLVFSDAASISGGDWFSIYSGTETYQVWFSKDGAGSIAPNEVIQGSISVQVDIVSGNTATQVRQAVTSALGAASASDFNLSSSGGNTLDVQTIEKGNVLDVWKTTSSGLTVATSVVQQGVSSMDKVSIAKAVRQALITDTEDTSAPYTKYLEVSYVGNGQLQVVNAVDGSVVDASTGTLGGLTVNVLQQGASAVSSLSSYAMGDWPHNAYLEDMDGDGDLDLLTHDKTSLTASIRLNDGFGVFGAKTSYTMGYNWDMYLVDLNADGRKDLVAADTDPDWWGNTLQVRINSGSGTFGSLATYTMGPDASYPATPRFADIDGDLDKDMILAEMNTGNVSVRRNDGTGVFGARTEYTMGSSLEDSYLEDIDGDGDVDLLATESWIVGGSGPVYVRLNDGAGVFGARAAYTMTAYISNAYLEDLNGDGDKDIIAISSSNSRLTVRLNDGVGGFGALASYVTGTGPKNAYLEDVDGDGDKDILTTDADSDCVSLFLNNGAGAFGARVIYTMGDNPWDAVLEDLNGDGRKDLLTIDSDSDTISVRLNTGGGTFGARAIYTGESATLLDLNGDGSKDLISCDTNSDIVTVRFNDGNGIFGAKVSYTMGDFPMLSVGDVDGDGSQDLVTAEKNSDTVSIRLNDGVGGFGGIPGQTETTTLTFADGESSGGASAVGSALVEHISLATKASALEAMEVLQSRLAQIGLQTGALGAIQSRLQVALDTVSAARENYLGAESRIRDVDVASEAARLLKAQVIQQAAQSILGQANGAPSLALMLLL